MPALPSEQPGRVLRRVLIVEDDETVSRALRLVFVSMGCATTCVRSIAEGLQRLDMRPDLLVLDVRLPDGNGVEMARTAWRTLPAPVVIAMSGGASPEETFALAQAGVRAFLSKPISVDDLRATVERVMRDPPAVEPVVLAQVGHLPVKLVQDSVRKAMVEQALALSGGHHGRAAELLKVSRQAVQQYVLQRGVDPSVDPGRKRRAPGASKRAKAPRDPSDPDPS